jgi:hypothetical protein
VLRQPTAVSTTPEERENYRIKARTLDAGGGMLAAAALLSLSGAALATNQSQQRQEGRNANRNAKQEARSNDPGRAQ